jgi:glutamate-1-semialdehyde aminotransferase
MISHVTVGSNDIARDEGAPDPRPRYSKTYYGAYVRDADGNKLQAVCYRAE